MNRSPRSSFFSFRRYLSSTKALVQPLHGHSKSENIGNLGDYEAANEIDVYDLIVATTNIVIVPSDAFYKTGDSYELVSIKFKDGTAEERSFSAFKGSVSDDESDFLTELVRYEGVLVSFDRLTNFSISEVLEVADDLFNYRAVSEE